MDLFILKTDVEKFTSTNKKTLHLIFNNKLSDNDDSEREIKIVFVRCNILRTRFNVFYCCQMCFV